MGLLQGVDHLHAGLVLIVHQGVVVLFAQVGIGEAHQGVAVHLHGVVGQAVGVHGLVDVLHHHGAPGFLADGVQVVIAALGFLLVGAAVPDTKLREEAVLGQHGFVEAVAEADVIVGHKGHNDGEQQQDDNQGEGHHGALVLLEAEPCVLEIADGLGFQLGVVDPGVPLGKGELFRGDVHHISFFHHFFDPILILGSMNP